uniref:Uncharacterized protein n=1 Tax=Moniliophthora roreri TaxID=221103 RepID=A0A0W0F0T1_MONRR
MSTGVKKKNKHAFIGLAQPTARRHGKKLEFGQVPRTGLMFLLHLHLEPTQTSPSNKLRYSVKFIYHAHYEVKRSNQKNRGIPAVLRAKPLYTAFVPAQSGIETEHRDLCQGLAYEREGVPMPNNMDFGFVTLITQYYVDQYEDKILFAREIQPSNDNVITEGIGSDVVDIKNLPTEVDLIDHDIIIVDTDSLCDSWDHMSPDIVFVIGLTGLYRTRL